MNKCLFSKCKKVCIGHKVISPKEPQWTTLCAPSNVGRYVAVQHYVLTGPVSMPTWF